ncbi:hypothetical protein PMZ80_006529 [Knufia obscura]|uniref:Uncharacterized protein n=2 Tax=Knufia TaxID=430999 RepID=A0AAN8EGD7_9EURO|nr:hypothetical protein PMZ80_006529 [Knufia obscura]KAK5950888.1 hypothetical protein OHC33_007959 [Knufia fluminis]
MGMMALPDQLLTAFVLGVSMLLLTMGAGVDNEMIGSSVKINRVDHVAGGGSRAAAYGRLALSKEEEDSMVAWGLMPHRRNQVWWPKYQDCVAQNKENAFGDWKDASTWKKYEDQASKSK